MVLRQARPRRHIALFSVIALTIALFAVAGHRHERDDVREAACAVCTVAHHSPTVAAAAPLVVATSEQIVAGITPAVAPPHHRERSAESGRSPPFALSA